MIKAGGARSVARRYAVHKEAEDRSAENIVRGELESKQIALKNKKWVLPSREELATIEYVDDDTVDNRPLLTENCSYAYYSTLDEKFLSYENGKVYLEEYPVSSPHNVAVTSLASQLFVQAGNLLEEMRDTSYVTPAGEFQPDTCFVPSTIPQPGRGSPLAANANGDAWPTFMVEVCYKRSLQTGITKAHQWLAVGTGVQIVVVIKLYPRTAAGFGMVALRFDHTAAGPVLVTAITSGTHPLSTISLNIINNLGGAQVVGVGVGGAVVCNAPGIPIYQLHLPTNLLMVGAIIIPVGAPALPVFYTIDLYSVQQRVNLRI